MTEEKLLEVIKDAYSKTIGSELDMIDSNGIWRNADGTHKTKEQLKKMSKFMFKVSKWFD